MGGMEQQEQTTGIITKEDGSLEKEDLDTGEIDDELPGDDTGDILTISCSRTHSFRQGHSRWQGCLLGVFGLSDLPNRHMLVLGLLVRVKPIPFRRCCVNWVNQVKTV